MTTMSNEAIVAELGWTMQIIFDQNGGRVPKYWVSCPGGVSSGDLALILQSDLLVQRPPYGDLDNRVRTIALEVFGLTSVVWNADSR